MSDPRCVREALHDSNARSERLTNKCGRNIGGYLLECKEPIYAVGKTVRSGRTSESVVLIAAMRMGG